METLNHPMTAFCLGISLSIFMFVAGYGIIVLVSNIKKKIFKRR